MKKNNMLRRTLLVLVAAALLMSSFAGAALAASYVQTTGNRVNVRSGPGTGYKALYTLVKGEEVEYLGSSTDSKGNTWYKIQYYSYGTGWIHSQYGKVVERGYVQASGGDVNVRSTPSLNGSDLTTMKNGQKADYLGQTSTDDRGVIWYKVSFNGYTGWVSSRYSKLVNDSSVTLPDFNFSYGYVKVTGNTVNVRKSPSLNGADLTTLKKGATVTYLGQTSTDDRGVVWYKVDVNGSTGWISSRYSELTNTASSALPDFRPVTKYVKADEGDCNIRNTPSLSGKDLGTMKRGQSAEYLNQSSTDDRGVVWYKISYNGVTGWVSSRYSSIV